MVEISAAGCGIDFKSSEHWHCMTPCDFCVSGSDECATGGQVWRSRCQICCCKVIVSGQA